MGPPRPPGAAHGHPRAPPGTPSHRWGTVSLPPPDLRPQGRFSCIIPCPAEVGGGKGEKAGNLAAGTIIELLFRCAATVRGELRAELPHRNNNLTPDLIGFKLELVAISKAHAGTRPRTRPAHRTCTPEPHS